MSLHTPQHLQLLDDEAMHLLLYIPQHLQMLDYKTFFLAVTNENPEPVWLHNVLQQLVGHEDIRNTLCKITENEMMYLKGETEVNSLACAHLASKLNETWREVLDPRYGENCSPPIKFVKKSL